VTVGVLDSDLSSDKGLGLTDSKLEDHLSRNEAVTDTEVMGIEEDIQDNVGLIQMDGRANEEIKR